MVADKRIEPAELDRLRQFLHSLALGAHAYWLEYELQVRVDEVPCNWTFRVAEGRSLADYVIDFEEQASRPEAKLPYVLDVSMMPLNDGSVVQHLHASVRADCPDDLLSALITVLRRHPVAGGGPWRTLRR